MEQLDSASYAAAQPLFRPLEYHLAVQAILEGAIPAPVYADDPARPQAALLWHKSRLYLAGSPRDDACNQALGRLVAERIVPQTRAAGGGPLALYYAPAGWEQVIERHLGDTFQRKIQRQLYSFDVLRNDWRELLPAGFALRPVDRALLDSSHLRNRDALRAEMCSERASVEDFLAASFGVCLLHSDEIVGWCLSEYNSATSCEVGIETLEPYRRRGFATLLASALIEEALARGIARIGWHCYAGNAASIATALKVGFRKALDYPAYVGLISS